jgi:heptose I phosphotransferase
VLARVARTLHENGFCHRDLYLCHFLVRRADAAAEAPAPVLIDLHRARAGQPRLLARWRRRDLAALLLSAAELPLTRADRLRFVRAYRGGSTLRAALAGERRFWSRVTRRAARVRERHRARYGVDPARAGSGA